MTSTVFFLIMVFYRRCGYIKFDRWRKQHDRQWRRNRSRFSHGEKRMTLLPSESEKAPRLRLFKSNFWSYGGWIDSVCFCSLSFTPVFFLTFLMLFLLLTLSPSSISLGIESSICSLPLSFQGQPGFEILMSH